jgi:hypothetical protein
MQKAQQMMLQLQMSGQLPPALAQQLLGQQQAAAQQSPQSPSYQQGSYPQEYGSPRSAPAVSTTGEMSLAPVSSSSQGQGQAAGGRPSMPDAPVSSAFRMSTTEALPLQLPGASSSYSQASRCCLRLQRCLPLRLPLRALGLPAAALDCALSGGAYAKLGCFPAAMTAGQCCSGLQPCAERPRLPAARHPGAVCHPQEPGCGQGSTAAAAAASSTAGCPFAAAAVVSPKQGAGAVA